MPRISRALVRYHGGKWQLAHWILSHFPAHRVYVEPYGGAASVLLKKPRAPAEVYNDLDSRMVNLFRVVRDRGADLKRAVELTPFAREEFDLAWEPTDDAFEGARRTMVRAAMGRDSASATMSSKSSFRVYVGDKRPATTMADWVNYPASLDTVIARLRGVALENRDGLDVMAAYDGPDTLHYVDPPYVFETRDKGRRDYRHEFDTYDHEAMLTLLVQLQGRVVLSGYDNLMYQARLSSWTKVVREAHADGASPRTEVLWISPECAIGSRTRPGQ